MDFLSLIQLITLLTGPAEPGAFETLKDGGHTPAFPVSIHSCPRPLPAGEIDGVSIVCGKVNVPEDHGKPAGRRIDLVFTVLKSSTMFPESDPVLYLEGGPGGSAVTRVPLFERVFRPWRARRDIVMFDQRSAGISGSSVNCYNALSAGEYDILKPADGKVNAVGLPDTGLIGRCVEELKAKGIDISRYNTTENAADVQAVMAALGYPVYNIYGISYGTKLALEVTRAKPKGLRAVILDGVAPPWVHLYNSFAFKTDAAIQTVVDQCKADAACNSTYPDLGRVTVELLNRAAAGTLIYKGEKIPVELVVAPINARNGKYQNASITGYIPAYLYELHRGKETPTVDMLIAANFTLPKPGEAELAAAAARLPAEQQALVGQAADNLVIRDRAEKGLEAAIDHLRASVENSNGYGPIAGLFDQELEKAVKATLKADKSLLRPLLADYSAMQNVAANKMALRAFVTKYAGDGMRDRLLTLIDSMSPSEVEGSFAIIRRDTYASQESFLSGLYLNIYACQEDIPFNSLEGYRKVTASLAYPHLGDKLYDDLAEAFFETCKPFAPHAREHWHEPVVSDIPTLSFGSLYDIQTPAVWAQVAIEKMSQAQAFLIPEAGHAAVVYQPCVADMGVAFFDNPQRKFDNSCAESIHIAWHIAEWAKPKP